MSDLEFDLYLTNKYHRLKNSAHKREVEFNLPLTSLKNMLKASKCHYTGKKIKIYHHLTSGDTIPLDALTIDRIDNKKGYVKGNVVACSEWANRLKNFFETDAVPLSDGLKTMKSICKTYDGKK